MIDFQRLFGSVRNHGWLFTLIVLLIIVGVTAGVQLQPPSYQSEAKLLVNIDRMYVSASRADVKEDVAMAQAVDAVTSQAEILRSHELIEKLVDELGPDFFASPPPKNPLLRQAFAIYSRLRGDAMVWLVRAGLVQPDNPRYDLMERIKKSLVAYPVRQSEIIDVVFRWPTPEVPAQALHTLIRLYLAKIGTLDVRANSIGVFEKMTEAASANLEKDENELSQLKARYAVHDLDAERGMLMERINKLTVQLEGVGGIPIPDSAEGSSTPPSAAAGSPPYDAMSDDGALTALHRNVDQLRIEAAKLRSQFSPGYARVQEVEAQLKSAEKMMAREANVIRGSITAYRQRLQLLDSIDPQMRRIQRAIAIDLDTYQTYRKATEDRRATIEQDSHSIVQIADPPSVPYVSTAPSRLLLLLAGIAAAPILGLLFTALLDVLVPSKRRRAAVAGAAAREAASAGSD